VVLIEQHLNGESPIPISECKSVVAASRSHCVLAQVRVDFGRGPIGDSRCARSRLRRDFISLDDFRASREAEIDSLLRMRRRDCCTVFYVPVMRRFVVMDQIGARRLTEGLRAAKVSRAWRDAARSVPFGQGGC
jgi:hypothetical protein